MAALQLEESRGLAPHVKEAGGDDVWSEARENRSMQQPGDGLFVRCMLPLTSLGKTIRLTGTLCNRLSARCDRYFCACAEAATDGQCQINSVQKRIALCGDEIDLGLIETAPHVQQLEIADIALPVAQFCEISRAA